MDLLKLFFTCLLAGLFVLYTWGIFDQYMQGLTTFALQQVILPNLPLPTMTICPDKALKASVLSKHNTSKFYFETPTLELSQLPMEESPTELYKNASYLLGRDYNISVARYLNIVDSKMLALGMNSFNYNESGVLHQFIVELEEISTLSLGTCLTITPHTEIQAVKTFVFTIEYDPNLKEEMPTAAIVKMSTPSEAYGFALTISLNYKPYQVNVDMGTSVSILLEMVEVTYVPRKELCHTYPSGSNVYSCIAAFAFHHMKTTNSHACASVGYQAVLGIQNTCNNRSDELQFSPLLQEGLKAGIDACKVGCSKVEYLGENLESHELDNKHQMKIYQFFATTVKKVRREQLLYDHLGMLGSVGGSLGLFLGGSILDLIFATINCLRSYCRKRCNYN